jgi:hypothetical protein
MAPRQNASSTGLAETARVRLAAMATSAVSRAGHRRAGASLPESRIRDPPARA